MGSYAQTCRRVGQAVGLLVWIQMTSSLLLHTMSGESTCERSDGNRRAAVESTNVVPATRSLGSLETQVTALPSKCQRNGCCCLKRSGSAKDARRDEECEFGESVQVPNRSRRRWRGGKRSGLKLKTPKGAGGKERVRVEGQTRRPRVKKRQDDAVEGGGRSGVLSRREQVGPNLIHGRPTRARSAACPWNPSKLVPVVEPLQFWPNSIAGVCQITWGRQTGASKEQLQKNNMRELWAIF
jgi:hypothetical protein